MHLPGVWEVALRGPPPLETVFYSPCLDSRACLPPGSSKTLLRPVLSTKSQTILTIFFICISFSFLLLNQGMLDS